MKRLLAVAVLVLSGALPATAADFPKDAYVGVLGDWLGGPGANRDPRVDQGYGGELILGTRAFDLLPGGITHEINLFDDHLMPRGTAFGSRRRTGGAFDLQYLFDRDSVAPYALAGIGVSNSNATPNLSTRWGPLAEVGVGLLLGPLSESGVRGRFEAKFTGEKFANDANPYLDFHVLAGIEIPICGARKAAEPAAAPAAPPVEAKPAPKAEPAPAPAPQPGVVKKVLTLKGVKFEPGSNEVTAASRPVLDEAAKTLNTEFPDAVVEVAGHTDNRGNADFNLGLSKRRAEAVRQYLVAHGVSASRLTAEGYGQTQPVADNATREGRAQNRRVELRVK